MATIPSSGIPGILPEITHLVRPTVSVTREMINAINCIDPKSPVGIAIRGGEGNTRVNFSDPNNHPGTDVLGMPHMNLSYAGQQCHLYLEARDLKDLNEPEFGRPTVPRANGASGPFPKQGDVVPGTYTMRLGGKMNLYPGVASPSGAAAAPVPVVIPQDTLTEDDFPPLGSETQPSGPSVRGGSNVRGGPRVRGNSRVPTGRGAPVGPSTSAVYGTRAPSSAGNSSASTLQPRLPNPGRGGRVATLASSFRTPASVRSRQTGV